MKKRILLVAAALGLLVVLSHAASYLACVHSENLAAEIKLGDLKEAVDARMKIYRMKRVALSQTAWVKTLMPDLTTNTYPEEVKIAVARGSNTLGELPQWAQSDPIYLAKDPIPIGSEKFLFYVLIGKRQQPFGLTAAGNCRYGKPREVKEDEYMPLFSGNH